MKQDKRLMQILKAARLYARFKTFMRESYLQGFNASGEGYNGEYPFQDKNREPEADADWCANRDQAINKILEI